MPPGMTLRWLPTMESVYGNKNNLWNILFVLILVIVLIIRLHTPFDRLTELDMDRDYLVAHHILAYHEKPLIGPNNSIIKSFPHSPVYYYFLATFLHFNDSLKFLRIINIFLQFFGVIVIFWLAKGLFGPRTAFTAGSLLLLSQRLTQLSQFPVHPVFVHPFLNLSLLFLFWFYQSKKYHMLLISLLVFMFSVAIHNVSFLLFPFFLGTVFMILKHHGAKKSDYIKPVGIMIALFFVFWGSNFIYFQRFDIVNSKPDLIVRSFSQFMRNFL